MKDAPPRVEDEQALDEEPAQDARQLAQDAQPLVQNGLRPVQDGQVQAARDGRPAAQVQAAQDAWPAAQGARAKVRVVPLPAKGAPAGDVAWAEDAMTEAAAVSAAKGGHHRPCPAAQAPLEPPRRLVSPVLQPDAWAQTSVRIAWNLAEGHPTPSVLARACWTRARPLPSARRATQTRGVPTGRLAAPLLWRLSRAMFEPRSPRHARSYCGRRRPEAPTPASSRPAD